MYKLLIGILLISVNFSIEIGYITIGLVPDFIGYILIGRALYELEDEAKYFVAAKGPVKIMSIVSILMYIIDLTGAVRYGFLFELLGVAIGIIYMLVGFACLIMFAYITYLITSGVQEMEGEYNEDMNGDKLMTAWKWMIGVKAVSYCLALIAPYLPFVPLALTSTLVLTLVIYLVQFYKSARAY